MFYAFGSQINFTTTFSWHSKKTNLPTHSPLVLHTPVAQVLPDALFEKTQVPTLQTPLDSLQSEGAVAQFTFAQGSQRKPTKTKLSDFLKP